MGAVEGMSAEQLDTVATMLLPGGGLYQALSEVAVTKLLWGPVGHRIVHSATQLADIRRALVDENTPKPLKVCSPGMLVDASALGASADFVCSALYACISGVPTAPSATESRVGVPGAMQGLCSQRTAVRRDPCRDAARLEHCRVCELCWRLGSQVADP